MKSFISPDRATIADCRLGRTESALPTAWSSPARRHRVTHPALLSSSLVRTAPIIFFQVYLTGSVVSFAFGPVSYDIANPFILYTYIAVAQLAIALGFKLGIGKSPRRYSGYLSVRALMQITILLTLILLPITLHYRNYGNLSLSEAIANPNAAYIARLNSFDGESTAPLLSTARGLLAPLLALFVPMGIVYWRSMGLLWRVLWGIGMVGVAALAIFSGAAVGLFDLVLVIPWMLWLALHHQSAQSAPEFGRPRSRVQGRSLFRRALLMAMTVTVLIAGIKYFNHSRQSRYQLASNEYPLWTTGWSYDLYGIPLPKSVEYTVYTISSYWSHGYEGLAECLELPFEWSLGCGHSRFWTRYLGALYSDPHMIEASTYPMRLQATSGYEAYATWHTVYPWLASDLTFYGAIVFMGCMGYLLALVWSDAVCKTNPFAVGFLAQLLIFFYYIPANNGRLSFPEETLAFWGTLILWTVTRERRVRVPLALQRGILHVRR